MGRARDDGAVLDHSIHHFFAEFGAHHAQGPVVVLADSAGGNVGVLCGEVGAHLASFAGPLMAFLQVDFVERAVTHPDLECALDIHLHHVFLAQAVLGQEEFLEDGIVERLGTEQTNVEQEGLADLSGLALPHDRQYR